MRENERRMESPRVELIIPPRNTVSRQVIAGKGWGKSEPRSTMTRLVTPRAVSVVICTGPK